jgi:hypothetical protein
MDRFVVLAYCSIPFERVQSPEVHTVVFAESSMAAAGAVMAQYAVQHAVMIVVRNSEMFAVTAFLDCRYSEAGFSYSSCRLV